MIEKLHYQALVKYQFTVKSQKFRAVELAVNLRYRVCSGGLKVETLIVDYCGNKQAAVTAGAYLTVAPKRTVVQDVGLTALKSHLFHLGYTQFNFASP